MTPLWIGIGIVTAIAVLALAVAARRRTATPADADETLIYKDQLAELERDVERGVVAPTDARAARLEIERRLLRAAERPARAAATAPLGRGIVLATAISVPLASLGLYSQLGRPSLPDVPFAARAPADDPLPRIAAMVAGLEERLAAEPNDAEGWLMLGRSRGVMGDPEGSVAAYRRGVELAAADPRAVAGLAESLISAAQGVVPPEAQERLRELERLDPADPRAGFYLGQAAAQAGQWQLALDRWRTVLARTPRDVAWREMLEEQVRQAAGELKLDPAPILALAAPPPPAQAPSTASGTEDQQKAFIASRVGQLREHLEKTPDDVDGWQRLAQAHMVLEQPGLAQAALRDGLDRNPDAPALISGIGEMLLGPGRADTGFAEVGDEALALFARASQIDPGHPLPIWYLGVRALQEGHRDEAIRRWDDALKKLGVEHPDYAALKARRDQLAQAPPS